MNEKEQAFWQLIQQYAEKQDAIFFMDCGEGNDLCTEEFEGEDFSGWLIPNSRVAEFQEDWNRGCEKNKKWDKFFCFAEWEKHDDVVEIEFKIYR